MKTADLLREAIDIEHSKPEDADEMCALVFSPPWLNPACHDATYTFRDVLNRDQPLTAYCATRLLMQLKCADCLIYAKLISR